MVLDDRRYTSSCSCITMTRNSTDTVSGETPDGMGDVDDDGSVFDRAGCRLAVSGCLTRSNKHFRHNLRLGTNGNPSSGLWD